MPTHHPRQRCALPTTPQARGLACLYGTPGSVPSPRLAQVLDVWNGRPVERHLLAQKLEERPREPNEPRLRLGPGPCRDSGGSRSDRPSRGDRRSWYATHSAKLAVPVGLFALSVARRTGGADGPDWPSRGDWCSWSHRAGRPHRTRRQNWYAELTSDAEKPPAWRASVRVADLQCLGNSCSALARRADGHAGHGWP
jgi:hypothetical protein